MGPNTSEVADSELNRTPGGPDIDATDKKALWAVCLPGNGQLPARRLIHRLRGEGISRQRS